MTRTISFTLNGAPVTADVQPHHNLVELLQGQFSLTGARETCGLAAPDSPKGRPCGDALFVFFPVKICYGLWRHVSDVSACFKAVGAHHESL